MNTRVILSPEEIKENTIEFFSRYTNEIENNKNKIVKQLQQLADDFMHENELPSGSVSILSRTKTLKSSLKKLELKGWPQFNYLPERITDIIGTRVICSFLDDCYGIEKYINQSGVFKIIKTENYIDDPKLSGYRAIHLTASLLNGGMEDKLHLEDPLLLIPFNFEIQIKTKLQNTWGDLSHEFYYKSKTTGVINKKYQSFLEKSSLRLFNEDKTLNKFKMIWETIKDDYNVGQTETHYSNSLL